MGFYPQVFLSATSWWNSLNHQSNAIRKSLYENTTMMSVEMAAYLSEMRHVSTIKQGFFCFYHPVINILGLTCSLLCNKRRLATPKAVETLYMQMQVGN